MKFNWKIFVRIAVVLLLLYSFYSTGLPLYYVAILGIIFIAVIFLRGKLYRKIDELLTKHFKFLSNVKPWIKKAIIIAVFIIIYVLLRELIYLILGLFGIDVQRALAESMNNSAANYRG